MRLIDADALNAYWECFDDPDLDYEYVFKADIDAAPTIDAVEVVRCKDCKYWRREIHNGIEYVNFSSCDLDHNGDGQDFYCADGERREK